MFFFVLIFVSYIKIHGYQYPDFNGVNNVPSFMSDFVIILGVVGWCEGAGLTSSAGASY